MSNLPAGVPAAMTLSPSLVGNLMTPIMILKITKQPMPALRVQSVTRLQTSRQPKEMLIM